MPTSSQFSLYTPVPAARPKLTLTPRLRFKVPAVKADSGGGPDY